MEDNEGECVDQGEDEHGPSNPVVPDVELLVGDASQSCDGICLCTEDAINKLAPSTILGKRFEDIHEKGHACQCHPARPSRNGRRVAVAEVFGVGPVVRTRAQSHG